MLLVATIATVPCLGGCGPLDVRSITIPDGVPSALQGEWQGAWQSGSGASGELIVRIQEFDRQPVVAVTIDNPCLESGDYELTVSGDELGLQLEGVPVLAAQLESLTQLVGSYGCAEDTGTWSATRVGPLPEPLDLSGTWSGSLVAPGVASPLVVQFDQVVRGGALALQGHAELPDLLPYALPVHGFVRFRERDFELVLQTMPGFEPEVVLSGIGDRDPARVPFGLLQVLSGQALPFSAATFQLVRQPD